MCYMNSVGEREDALCPVCVHSRAGTFVFFFFLTFLYLTLSSKNINTRMSGVTCVATRCKNATSGTDAYARHVGCVEVTPIPAAVRQRVFACRVPVQVIPVSFPFPLRLREGGGGVPAHVQ